MQFKSIEINATKLCSRMENNRVISTIYENKFFRRNNATWVFFAPQSSTIKLDSFVLHLCLLESQGYCIYQLFLPVLNDVIYNPAKTFSFICTGIKWSLLVSVKTTNLEFVIIQRIYRIYPVSILFTLTVYQLQKSQLPISNRIKK